MKEYFRIRAQPSALHSMPERTVGNGESETNKLFVQKVVNAAIGHKTLRSPFPRVLR